MGVAANVRVLDFPLTGVQRYTTELLARLAADVEPIKPTRPLEGIRGHLWEQAILPARLDGRLLWSPSNTGPLAVTRQVVTIHDAAPLDHPEWLNRRFAAWYRWLLPRLTRRVRRIIVPSEFTKSRLLDLTAVLPERVVVIPNGVDARFRPSPPDEIEATRAALGIPTPRYVLSLASLEPRKNLDALLRAWALLRDRTPDDLWLVVAGAPGKRLVFPDVPIGALPPRVHLTGRIDDRHLPALYSGALLFAYPSLYEGFGLPPLEAMACGAPVISSIRTSLPEVLGDAALLVEPNPEAIAAAIERAVDNVPLRATLRVAGLARAAPFTWDRTTEQTAQILHDAAR